MILGFRGDQSLAIDREASPSFGRRRRICRPAEQADHVSGAGRAWPAKIAPTLESPCSWRAVLSPIRPRINDRPADFTHLSRSRGGRNLNAAREAPSVAEAIIDVSDLSGSPSGYENHAWSQHSVATPVARSISAIGRGSADSPAKTPCRALRNCCSSVRKNWTVTAVSDSATGFRSPADAMMLRILNQGLPLHFECY